MVEPARPGPVAPLCIPVVGKVQLSSRLHQLLQKSSELDRLQALQQRRPPLTAHPHSNGHLKRPPPSPAQAVTAAGDGVAFRLGPPPPPNTPTATIHPRILPRPAPPQPTLPPPYKLDKIKGRHKAARAHSKAKLDGVVSKPKSRANGKLRLDPSADKASRRPPVRGNGVRPRVSPAPVPSSPPLPAPLRAYQQASSASSRPYRPLLPDQLSCSDADSCDEHEQLVSAATVARRYRQQRGFARCCRMLLERLRRAGGEVAARLCRRLLRPPAAGAADAERRQRLLARQRLEARRLLAALEEARHRRRQLAERAHLTRLLAAAAEAVPGRAAELLSAQLPTCDPVPQPGFNR